MVGGREWPAINLGRRTDAGGGPGECKRQRRCRALRAQTTGAGGRVLSSRSSALRCNEENGHPLRLPDRIVGQRECIECGRFQTFGPRAADREPPGM